MGFFLVGIRNLNFNYGDKNGDKNVCFGKML